jgi:integrase
METGITLATDNTELATTNAAAVYLASLASPHSRRAMGNALDKIARMAGAADADTCPWGAMRAQHTAAIRAQLTESGAAAATVNQALAALRGVLTAAWRLGQMTAEELARATDVKSVKAERAEAATGRAVTYGEAMALAASCNDGTPAGARDSAILAIAYACGLRRAEIAALDMADYTAATGRIMVAAGKGNKERELFVDNGAKVAFDKWLALRGPGAGAIFTPIRRGGHIAGGQMTAQAIYNVIVGRCESANVEGVTPHDFRRTFIGEMLDAGIDLATVATLAGHSDPKTTAGYDRRNSRARQQAASRIHWPATK